MSSEWELDEGIKSIKSAWRREYNARLNLEKMLESAESDNAKLRELLKDALINLSAWMGYGHPEHIVEAARELGVEVDDA